MEANLCDINHLDSDLLLPPRKRLLAGLKKQNLKCQSHQSSPPNSSELDTYLNNKLSSQLHNPNNLSPQELAESSKLTAIAAAQAAKAARATAEEKAIVAAKAISAARCALELVTCIFEETSSMEMDHRHFKKNKTKKNHDSASLMYKKHQMLGNFNTDEELAFKLHRDMNSSPRISKNHKHKKPKVASSFGKPRISNGGIVLEEISHSKYNDDSESSEVNSEDSIRDVYSTKRNGNTSRFCKTNQLEMGNDEAGPSHSKEQQTLEAIDYTSPNGRKRGRMKLKKLCSSDQTCLKEPTESVSSDKTVLDDVPTTWKCKNFEASQSIKQNNKVMQS